LVATELDLMAYVFIFSVVNLNMIFELLREKFNFIYQIT